MGRLTDKVAVVTGGATGLGAAIVELYAAEGAKVVFGDVRPGEAGELVERLRNDGRDVTFVRTDVTSSSDVEALVSAAEKLHGHLDIATANAGILGRGHKKSLVDITEDELREIINVNLVGVWTTFRYAIPALQRAGGGALTATASTSAERGTAKAPAYAASKGAIISLVQALAADLGPAIRVNAVNPGAMDTTLGIHTAESKGIDVKDVIAQAHGVRLASPVHSAQAHLFLVSEDAGQMTGQAITVDGGATSSMA